MFLHVPCMCGATGKLVELTCSGMAWSMRVELACNNFILTVEGMCDSGFLSLLCVFAAYPCCIPCCPCFLFLFPSLFFASLFYGFSRSNPSCPFLLHILASVPCSLYRLPILTWDSYKGHCAREAVLQQYPYAGQFAYPPVCLLVHPLNAIAC